MGASGKTWPQSNHQIWVYHRWMGRNQYQHNVTQYYKTKVRTVQIKTTSSKAK